MSNILTDLFTVFFPELCVNCKNMLESKGKYLCLSCVSELPLTHFSGLEMNQVEMTFRGRIPIEAGTSLLFFEKRSMVQKMIHQLKYKNKPEIGRFLGQWLAAEILLSKRFESADIVVPIPLHPEKKKIRGYNQVWPFAEAIANGLGIDISNDAVIREGNKTSQTLKNRTDRVLEEKSEFVLCKADQIRDKHVLLVDDIITTGATMQSCAEVLLAISGVRISLASMAFTT